MIPGTVRTHPSAPLAMLAAVVVLLSCTVLPTNNLRRPVDPHTTRGRKLTAHRYFLAAAIECQLATPMTAAKIRSEDDRSMTVSVTGGLVALTTPADAVTRVNAQIVSTMGQFSVESLTLMQSVGGTNFIMMSAVQVAGYTVYDLDNVTLTFVPDLFFGGVPCAPIVFLVAKSPGVLQVASVPAALSEITINTVDVTFDVAVAFDEFVSRGFRVTSIVSSFLRLTAAPAPVPNDKTAIRFTLHRNSSFNIAPGSDQVIRLDFPAGMMRTGLSPVMPDDALNPFVAITVQASPPLIGIVDFHNSDGALRCEDLWDGKAQVTLSLLGDTWLPDLTVWMDIHSGPAYTPQPPLQPYSFTYFLARGFRPKVTINGRNATISFPGMTGFTLSNVATDSLVVSGLNSLHLERSEIVPIPMRILQVRPDSAYIEWQSAQLWQSPSRSNTVSETLLRRQNLDIEVRVRYTVFTSPPNVFNWRQTFTARLGSKFTAANSIVIANVTTRTPLTKVTLRLPPNPSFDVTRSEVVNMTLLPSIFEASKLRIVNRKNFFTISSFQGTAVCSLELPPLLNESTVRDVTQPPLLINISIVKGADTFVDVGGDYEMLFRNLDATTVDDISSPTGYRVAQNLRVLAVEPTKIIMQLTRSADFQLNQDGFVGLTVPPEMMASLEPCKAFPSAVAPNPISFLQFSIRAMPGRITGTFPTITEVDMRTKEIVATVTFEGDSFFVGASVSNGTFRPFFDVTPPDTNPTARGFAIAIAKGVVATATNSSAVIRFLPNATYDAARTETVFLRVDAALTTSRLVPVMDIVPLIITAVNGNLTASLPTTNGSATLEETMINDGGYVFNFTLQYERWVPATVSQRVRSSLQVITAFLAGGMAGNVDTIFANDAFSFDGLQQTMTIRLKPAPFYDITAPETFSIGFTPDCFVSGLVPSGATTFTFTVANSTGFAEVSGTAVLAGTRDLIDGGVFYVISLHYDKWTPEIVSAVDGADICVLGRNPSPSSCTRAVSADLRNLTVVFQSLPDAPTVNTTSTIRLQPQYFASGRLPRGNLDLRVYVTPGRARINFLGGISQLPEDQFRDGTVPMLEAVINGDRFFDAPQVKASLVASVTCHSDASQRLNNLGIASVSTAAPSSQENQPFGFCARAAILFETVRFSCQASATNGGSDCAIYLQADANFDVFVPETVTLFLTGSSVQSRLSPNANTTFVITPTAGRFFVSTSFQSTLFSRSISAPEPLETSTVEVSLYGERWMDDPTEAMTQLLPTITSDAANRETDGFERHRSVILAPTSSPRLSSANRVLTMRLLPAPGYNIFSPEIISIKPPASSVLSGIAPVLASVPGTFTIRPSLGQVTSSPASTTATAVRDTGVNLTLTLTNDQWDSVALIDFTTVSAAVTTSASPAEEPHGFAVNRGVMMKAMEKTGALVKSTSLFLAMQPAPGYALLKSEVITIQIPRSWLNSKNLPTKVRHDFIVRPEYPVAEAVIFGGVNGSSASVAPDIASWTDRVANTLGVSPTQIEVYRFVAEPKVAPSFGYWRISFRVITAEAVAAKANSGNITTGAANTSATIYELYDNAASSVFVNLDRSFARTAFNVSLAFFNNSEPPAAEFARLAGVNAAGPDDGNVGLALNLRYLLYITGAIIVALVVALAVFKYRNRSSLPSQRWATSTRTGNLSLQERAADRANGVDDPLATTDAEERLLALHMYRGQTIEHMTLAGSTAAIKARGDPLFASDREGPSSQRPEPSNRFIASPLLATGAHSRFDENDDLDDTGYDVPMFMYSGQSGRQDGALPPVGKSWSDARQIASDAADAALSHDLCSTQANAVAASRTQAAVVVGRTHFTKEMPAAVERLLTLPPRQPSEIIYPPMMDRSGVFMPPSRFTIEEDRSRAKPVVYRPS